MIALGDLIKLDFTFIPEGEDRTQYLLAVLAAMILTLLLIVSAFYKFYDLTTVYLDYQQTLKLVETKPVLSQTIPETPTVAFNDYPIFGTAPVTVNEANSNYALIGIEFSPSHPDKGTVMIRSNGKEDEAYRVGDKLPGGAIVNSITTNEVIILNNGIAQRLSLSWEAQGGEMSATAAESSHREPRKGMMPRNKFFQNFPENPSVNTEGQ